jgi:hypothetical protein
MQTINRRYRAVVIDSKTDHQNLMLIPLMQLEKGDLDLLIVNGIKFNRDCFCFKNGNFNRAKAVRTIADAYMIRELKEIAAWEL